MEKQSSHAKVWKKITLAADILKEHPNLAIIIRGYTAKPSGKWRTNSLCAELARRRARSIQEALYGLGCLNRIVAEGVGYVDNLGPRCEVIPCSVAQALEKEEELYMKGEAVEQVKDDITMLAEAAELVPAPSLQVDFDCGDGVRSVTFTKAPWGICFDLTMPSIVTHVEPNSHADDLGVQAGWVFKTIAGQDVTNVDTEALLCILHDAAICLSQV